MVENLIAGYLSTTGKRLVIPDLGAFLKKDNGEVIFVEFLKKDDGILSELVSQSLGVPTLEAASIVLQFSADVKTSLGSKGFYVVPRVGTLRRDSSGAINLSRNTEAQQVNTTSAPTPAPASRVAATSPQTTAAESVPKPETPVSEPVKASKEPVKPAVSRPLTAAPPAMERTKITTEVYTAAPDRGPRKVSPGPNGNPKKKADMIMIIALAAALIAIGSMVYGLLVDSNPINNLQPVREQVIDAPFEQDAETSGDETAL